MQKKQLVELHSMMSAYQDFLATGGYLEQTKHLKLSMIDLERIVNRMPGELVKQPTFGPTLEPFNHEVVQAAGPARDLGEEMAHVARIGTQLGREVPVNMGYVLILTAEGDRKYLISTHGATGAVEIIKDFIRKQGGMI